jgi:hypothetical protein
MRCVPLKDIDLGQPHIDSKACQRKRFQESIQSKFKYSIFSKDKKRGFYDSLKAFAEERPGPHEYESE